LCPHVCNPPVRYITRTNPKSSGVPSSRRQLARFGGLAVVELGFDAAENGE
jgi:hypothetical protein